jgi:hypothetical protein
VVSREVFKQIFRDHWEGFREENPGYGDYHDGVIKKMLGCGDVANGFMAYRCLDCGEMKKVPFSCKSSFCLSCAKVYTEQWVEYISRALFRGMKYRHVVLTVPEELRKRFQEDTRLLGQLMRAGHAFYEDAVSYWLKKQVEVGSVVVLQTGITTRICIFFARAVGCGRENGIVSGILITRLCIASGSIIC